MKRYNEIYSIIQRRSSFLRNPKVQKWIAGNTVPSSKEKVYRLVHFERTEEDELPLEVVEHQL